MCTSQVAPLLSELGLELGELVSDSYESEQLLEQFSERALLSRLGSRTGQQGGGANLTALTAILEQLAKSLLPLAAPERAMDAEAAVAGVQQQLATALAGYTECAAGTGPAAAAYSAFAEALASALRLLMTLLKLVKLDAANARLGALAAAIKERGAVQYLRGKLAVAWELPTEGVVSRTEVETKLPRTAAWIAGLTAANTGGSGTLKQMEDGMSAAGLLLEPAAAAAAVSAAGAGAVGVPLNMRSGLRSPGGSSAGGGAAGTRFGMSGSPGPSPRGSSTGGRGVGVTAGVPVELSSWQGVLRAGLVTLVANDVPAATREDLPEVLQFDRERLHAAQNGLQQLLVLAGGLLLVQQLRGAAGLTWGAEERAAARRRLLVVLSDPSMKLSHLVTELSQFAGASSLSSETQVKNMFMSVVNPEGAGFKSLRTNLSYALLTHLLYGKAAAGSGDGVLAGPLGTVLARAGATSLSEDVAGLAGQLAGIAGVVEAVSGDWLGALVASA